MQHAVAPSPAALAYFAGVTASLWIIGGLAVGRAGYVRLKAVRLVLLAALAVGLGARGGLTAASLAAPLAIVLMGAWLILAGRALRAGATR